MTAVDASIGDLLKVGEEEFDNAIKTMTVKNLMSVISGLQREMSREQEAFNSLSGELQKNKGRNSRQYKQISKDMVASQQKLTLLMNRSMKCFAQQNSPHTNTSNSNHGGDAATGLRRRNSAKGPVAHTPPSALGVAGAGNPGGASRSAVISRSKSMHSVNHPGSPTAPQPPSLIASSSSSYSSSSTVAHAKTPGKPLVLNTSGPHKSGATSNRSSTFSSANAATANTNASDPLKPHMPIIMKPLQPNGIASTASTATSIASSFSSSSVAATSSSSTISSSTRTSTSASLTPHTRVVGNLPISSALASDGIQGAANSHNNNSKGTTNVEGASGLNPASEGSCNEDVSGKGGGGGLYVKRRFGQPPSRPAASNTTFESSSSSQPVPSNTPSSSSSSSASLPPRHPVHSRGRLQVVGSTRPAFSATSTNNTDLSPMLLSQSLSKSQGSIHHNHITELSPASATNGDLRDSSPASNDAFRGLPSVRQLAQSFGSMSALNTASASASSSANSGYTRNSRLNGGGGTTSGRSSSSLLFSPGKGVTRSSSSVGFLRGPPSSSSSSSSSALSSSPSTSVSTHRLFLTNKGSNGNNNNINGKNDAPLVQQQKLQPNGQPLQQQNSSSNHLNGSAGVQQPQPQQQQQQRPIRQPSAGRGPGSSSSFSVPASSSSAATTTEAENQLALARARLKNRNSRGITVETQNPKSESAVTSPTMESSSSNLPSQTQIPVAINEASVRQPTAAAVVTSPPTTATSSATTSTVNLNLESNNKGNKEIKPVNHTPSSLDTDATFASSTKISSSLSSSPPTKSNNDDGINSISTSAANSSNNLRRSRSREELDQPKARLYRKSQQSGQGKETLLQQIQARRRYDDDDDEVDGGSKESNFRSISKLSMSMPSLLQTDPDQGDGSKERPIKSSVVLPPKTVITGPDGSAGASDGTGADNPSGSNAGGQDAGTANGGDDKVEQTARMNLRDWDPDPVIKKLYELKLMEEQVEDISHQFISMEGLMEKLPMNKKKATLLKTWKRRFFRAKDGWLYYYETSNRDRPSETIQLMGGNIIDLGNRVLGIDDGRGRYLMVRCPTEKEHGQWVIALESQTADNTKATYVRPALAAARHPKKKVVVIDLGSSSIRAGVLGDQASLPELFIPSVVAIDPQSGNVLAVGQDALTPFMRHKCNIVYPIRPSNKVDQFNIEVQLMGALFSKVFQELKVKPADYWVMLSTPQNLGDPLKQGLMQRLVDELNVAGVCMVQQALFSLYSYNATSGIIVDIGHRIEILPIFDGFVIEGGVARCPYGAQKVQESLTTSLLGINYKFRSETEQLLVRYIMEQSCYVAIDYAQEEEFCKDQPQTIRTSVNLAKFKLPEGSYETVEHDLSRFKSPEGFFNADLWEMDYPTLQKLIHRAIQTCPMDNRRHMWRAVFLSGGVTLLPGFAERLERELTKLAPPGVPVEVHAAPQRYHAAFVGACSVALMPQFESSAISREEWKKEGCRAFRKWQAPS